MGSTLKKVLIAFLVLILVAVIGLCVSIPLLNRSDSDGDSLNSSDSADSDDNTDADNNTDSDSNAGAGSNTNGDGNANAGSNTNGGGNANAGSNTNGGSATGGSGNTDADTDSDSDKKYSGLFAGTSTDYVLTSDYTFTKDDIEATDGDSDVTVNDVCTFNLSGYTLNLGGYTLNINTASKKVVRFTNGKITNGTVKVSIPNGDVEFNDTEIDKSVTYELQAASETIRFSNAVIGGKCTIKSNTRVSVEYSTVSDINFDGNGTLVAGNKASLGTVTVSEKAVGATLNIAPTASVTKVELRAAATVDVSGEVANISVESTANGASLALRSTATVATVAVNAGNTKIESDNAAVTQVLVADSVKNTLNAKGVEVTGASVEQMKDYLGHLHVLKVVSDVKATCETDGETNYKCEGCGVTSSKTTPAFGHKYSYTVQKEPAENQDGVYIYTCSRCQDSYTATISSADLVYYHIDVAMIDRSNKDFITVRLKYVSDATGEYYLLTKTQIHPLQATFTETVSTVKLACTNGLPEIKPESENDCTGWLQLSLDYEAQAETVQTEITGGIVKITDGGYEVVDGGRGKTLSLGMNTVKFSGKCYSNVKTGEITDKSAHKLTVTGSFKDGVSCSGGTNVTIKCENCSYSKEDSSSWHYYVEDKKALPTQCNSFDDYFVTKECAVCHTHTASYSLDYGNHKIESVSVTVLTDEEYAERASQADFNADKYAKLSDLAAAGFPVDGFYHSYSAYSRHCAMCGLNIYEYNYYTHTEEEGCLYHSAYVFDYKGNADFEGFEYSAHVSSNGHYTRWGYNNPYDNASDAVAEVKSHIGEEEIPFTTETAYYDENKCVGCGMLFSKRIYLQHGEYDDYCKLDLSYSDGEVSSWTYYYYYNFENALKRAKEVYGLTTELDGLTQVWRECFYCVYSNGGIKERMDLCGDGIWFSLDRNTDWMELTLYYGYQCKEMRYSYAVFGDEWVRQSSQQYVRHFNPESFGENCLENGKFCTQCNQGVISEHDYYGDDWLYHNMWVPSVLTNDNIASLDASIDYGRDCHDCRTYIGVVIVLNSDWTLTNDVTFKAEGITIDLNGHSINLNGHTLSVYSYAGAYLTVTDRKYDTSVAGGNASSISNGTLSLTSIEGLCGGEGDIVIGTVNIDCQLNVVDTL